MLHQWLLRLLCTRVKRLIPPVDVESCLALNDVEHFALFVRVKPVLEHRRDQHVEHQVLTVGRLGVRRDGQGRAEDVVVFRCGSGV